MANVSLHSLLGSQVITRAISRIKTPSTLLQDWWGMGMSGPNTTQQPGRSVGWDIYDKVRTIAKGRAPGTGPAMSALNPVGHVDAQCYRAHEKVHLLEDRIYRTRAIGQQWGTVDSNGQKYVTKQEGTLSQKFKNNREFMVSRMMKGSFQLKQNGDDWIPVDSGGTFTIDFQIPAANKSQLDLLGAGDIIGASWATETTDVMGDCFAINAAFEQLHGRPLRHIWCDSTIIQYMMVNDGLQAAAGTANVVFNRFNPLTSTNEEGIPNTGFEVVFRGLPWITWHVYDAGLDVDGTFTKFFPNTVAVFLPDPSPDIAEMIEGSEIVAENVLDPGKEKYGFTAWSTRVIDPAGWELKALDNCITALYLPKCIAYGTVVF